MGADAPLKARRRILLCDDDVSVTDLQEALLTRKGFDVTVLNDSGLVSKALAQRSYDLIILDQAMPGKNGDEIIRDIRRGASSARDTAIILYSGNPPGLELRPGFVMTEADLLALGRVMIMRKPAGVTKYMAAIHECLGSA